MPEASKQSMLDQALSDARRAQQLEQKTFYVASSLINAPQARAIAHMLETHLGWKCTYRWFDLGKVDPAEWERVSIDEKQGVLDAQHVIVLLPGKFGAHTELGIAIGKGDTDIVVASPRGEHFEDGPITGTYPSIFYFLPEIHRVAHNDTNDLYRQLAAHYGATAGVGGKS